MHTEAMPSNRNDSFVQRVRVIEVVGVAIPLSIVGTDNLRRIRCCVSYLSVKLIESSLVIML